MQEARIPSLFGELRSSVPHRQNKTRNQMSETINEYLCNVGDESVFLRITPEASALRKRLMHFTLQKLKKEFRTLKASMISVLCQIRVLNIVSQSKINVNK